MGGVSFDRAAKYYDATRGLPADVLETVVDTLAAEITGGEPCLEIGVGTGRIALPLYDRGFVMIGADIAPAMLQRLVANAGGRPFPLLIADATRLPLAASSVQAVMASHVLHLIPEWKAAVGEAMRVLRPGGVLLVDFGGRTTAPWTGPCEEILHRHGVFQIRPGVSDAARVAEHLGETAEVVKPLRPVAMVLPRRLGQDLDEWQRQIHSWTWPYRADQMRAACDDVRAWAAGHGWSMDEEVELERTVQWWAFVRAQ